MPRKKLPASEKSTAFGISLPLRLIKLTKQRAAAENVSLSHFIKIAVLEKLEAAK